MPQTEQLRKNLLDKIKELFQLNQPELDFGFYRIMHSRAREITQFIEHDLFDTIQNAFDSAKAESAQTELEAAKAKLFDAIGEDAFDENGHLKPAYANSKAGREFLAAQQRAAASDAVAGGEESVYYHLHKFFSRYYEGGDFISTRYHTRETGSMAKPYAVPYGGEEVMLHWANADQYYIKTAENFNNYTFDLAKAKVFDALSHEERILAGIPDHALMVHFKVVEAEEGEHGNIKADPNKKREFFPARKEPVALNAAGELEIRFEYRQPEESDAISAEEEARVKARFEAKNKGDVSLLVMTERILAACRELRQCFEAGGGRVEHLDEFLTAMEYPCPTDTVKKRVLLTRYLYQYTARNTADYFIHKDLRGFLRREMDFYIKNEIMNLDDIENSDVAAVENYLMLLKVFRRIAGKLIDFLGQLEDFQKKLWLKKKFVVQCDCCITLDRVPESFYPEILRNRRQWEKWKELGLFDQIDLDDISPADTVACTVKFTFNDFDYLLLVTGKELKITKLPSKDFSGAKDDGYVHLKMPMDVDIRKDFPHLMVDTKFFSEDFKARLYASIPDFDEQCDGVLIHSENFQALNLLRERYHEQVKCIYIDPPYNTGSDGFIYRDNYQHSCWMSMIADRIAQGLAFSKIDGAILASIDEIELVNLRKIFDTAWGNENYVADFIWAAGRKNDSRLASISHEYMICYARSKQYLIDTKTEWRQRKKGLDTIYAQYNRLKKKYKDDYDQITKELKKWYKELPESDPAKLNKHYSVVDSRGIYFPADISWPGGGGPKYTVLHPVTQKPVKIPSRGWMTPDPEKMEQWIKDNLVHFGADENSVPCIKSYLKDNEYQAPYSVFYQDGRAATKRLRHILGNNDFGFPKDENVIADIISTWTLSHDLYFDYFAGSGTTGHAVINLNREDGGKRKYILVEMGDHFDTVLKPRLEKVVFAKDWKDGKPQSAGPRATRKDSKKTLGLDVEADQLGFALMEDDKLTDSGVVNLSNPFNGVSHCFKYMRLESYEDTLNNLTLPEESAAEKMPPTLREDYMLHYLLDTEARDSLLNIRDFANPFGGYLLNIKQPASEASVPTRVDLMETFHYLIGLRVQQYYTIQSYRAEFRRSADPELPDNGAGQRTRLELAARPELNDDGPWRFQKIEGWIPANPLTPNDGRKKNVLIVWRTLTGDLERDNLMLDWYLGDTINLNEKRPEYDIIYVNGSNNLGADRRETDLFQVRLIEEEFLKQMWSGEEC